MASVENEFDRRLVLISFVLIYSAPCHPHHHYFNSTKGWAKKNIEPYIAKHWEAGTLPDHFITNFQRDCPHLLGFSLPQEYGGQGYDTLTVHLIAHALASVDGSFTTALLVQYGLCADSIVLCGNEAQKRRFLPDLSRLTKIGCFCLTEPASGSDASNLTTIAKETTRRINGRLVKGYEITGSKRWIGNGTTAEVFVVWARNVSLPNHPVMGFIVERSQQQQQSSSPQLTTTKIIGKASLRMTQNANVELRKAWCPMENVMSDHGKHSTLCTFDCRHFPPSIKYLILIISLSITLLLIYIKVGFGSSVGRVLEASRLSVAWVALGVTIGAVDATVPYVQERTAFGAPLASNQLIQGMYRSFVYYCCNSLGFID